MSKPAFLSLVVVILCFSCNEHTKKNIKISGPVFGTSYGVKYYSETEGNLQKDFDSLFNVINQSLSTYRNDSDISKINRNEPVEVDDHFKKVFNTSKKIYKSTDKSFDPTIGAVVNAWNFGPKGKVIGLDNIKVDSLMRSVGLNKVVIDNGFVVKENQNTFLDFNAIAKGYGVDVLADYLESKNINNYIVEIGGEIRTKGYNIERNKPWVVGVERPNFDGTQSVLRTVKLSDNAMATSGTYRKYSIDENGKRYSHIIDTKTGYPSKTNVLSVSVIAPNCMTADAYATAFQAMGMHKVTKFLKDHPEIKAYFIFENEEKALDTLNLNGFPN